jgi:predicted  nucleic acid-binding Zn-ribbon protein
MTEPAKKDDFLKSLGIEMDAIKARLIELRASAEKLAVEARQDLDRALKALEPRQKQLEAKIGEWAKVGKTAGAEVAEGLKRAAKELKKSVDEAATRLKK